jgi:hypothetical protein
MALRLKYDDINTTHIQEDLNEALKEFIVSIGVNKTGVIFATYTAMLVLRQHLAKVTKVEYV